MSNFNKMLKQAQKMQKEVESAQNKLAEMEVTFSNNGVDVVAKGDFTIKSISVNEDLIKSGDKEMIDDVLLVAINGALDKVRGETESKLSGITGGMDLSSLLGR